MQNEPFFDAKLNSFSHIHIHKQDQWKGSLFAILEVGKFRSKIPNFFIHTNLSKQSWVILKVCRGQGIVMSGNECYGLMPNDTFILSLSESFSVSNYDWEVQYAIISSQYSLLESVNGMLIGNLNYDHESTFLDLLQMEFPKTLNDKMILDRRLMEWFRSFIQEQDQTESCDTRIRSSLLYIERHLHEKITVQDLAHESGYSLFHFSRLFTEQVGSSPYSYIISRRITNACTMLTTTDIPVTDIGSSSGFLTLTSFYKEFRKHLSTTPFKYRLNYINSKKV